MATVLLAGCTLYFDHPKPDAQCVNAFPPAISIRDPSNGVCQPVDFGCNNSCQPCGMGGATLPDWADCDGRCEAHLDAASCAGAAECRIAFKDHDDHTPPQFLGCWGTAPGSSTQPVTCAGLDAFGCSQHESCSAVYFEDIRDGHHTFARCIAEPIVHDPGLCTAATCNIAPPHCPGTSKPGVAMGCYTGYCIPADKCGQRDAGSCEDATQCDVGSSCPAGTVGGTTDGCYNGFCIPLTACP